MEGETAQAPRVAGKGAAWNGRRPARLLRGPVWCGGGVTVLGRAGPYLSYSKRGADESGRVAAGGWIEVTAVRLHLDMPLGYLYSLPQPECHLSDYNN